MKRPTVAMMCVGLSLGCAHTERHVVRLPQGSSVSRPSEAIVSTESLERPFRETKLLYVLDAGDKSVALEKLRRLGSDEGCDGVVLARVHEGQNTQASGICVEWRHTE